jgi:hypothetical protein
LPVANLGSLDPGFDPSADRFKRLKFYIVFAVIGTAIVVVGFYPYSSEPMSFTATGIRYANTGTGILVFANITDSSKPGLVDLAASIDGMADGYCGAELATNQSIACDFGYPNGGGSFVSCSQLAETQDHVLTLSAYFTYPGWLIYRGVTNTYSVTGSQLYCS